MDSFSTLPTLSGEVEVQETEGSASSARQNGRDFCSLADLRIYMDGPVGFEVFEMASQIWRRCLTGGEFSAQDLKEVDNAIRVLSPAAKKLLARLLEGLSSQLQDGRSH